jgi:hypothetical protein
MFMRISGCLATLLSLGTVLSPRADAQPASPQALSDGPRVLVMPKQDQAAAWGSYLDVRSPLSKDEDANLVGLKVDMTNYSRPGVAPYHGKVGIQIAGLGDSAMTNAVEVLGVGGGRWTNGVLFQPGAVDSKGTVLALGGPGEVARGIDFSQVRFTSGALLVGNQSEIALLNKTGGHSAIYTDALGSGYLVLRGGIDGVRITDNANARNLLQVDSSGNLITPMGNFRHIARDVNFLKTAVVVLMIVVIVQGFLLSRLSRQKRQPS